MTTTQQWIGNLTQNYIQNILAFLGDSGTVAVRSPMKKITSDPRNIHSRLCGKQRSLLCSLALLVVTYTASSAATLVYPSDSQATIQAALNSAGEVVFTAGVYPASGAYTAGFTITNKDIKIRGEGDNRTTIKFGGTGVLFDFAFADPSQNAVIEDITLMSTNDSSDSNTALKFTYPSPDLQRHTDPGPQLSRVHIDVQKASGESWTGSWAYGVRLYKAWNTKITNCFFANNPGSFASSSPKYKGSAISIDDRSLNCSIHGTSFGFWRYGIKLAPMSGAGVNHEGLAISNCYFVPVWRGIEYHNPSSQSIVTLLQMSNCHIHAQGTMCMGVLLTPVADFQMTNCNIYVEVGTTSNLGWHLAGTMFRSNIGNNSFVTVGNGGGTGGGVVLTQDAAPYWDSDSTIVHNNTLDNITNASSIWLQTGSHNCVVSGNVLISSYGINDQGTGNHVYNNH